MKSIHKTKDQINLSINSSWQRRSKRDYHFHPDEDFREDLDWKQGDSDLPKLQRPAKKTNNP